MSTRSASMKATPRSRESVRNTYPAGLRRFDHTRAAQFDGPLTHGEQTHACTEFRGQSSSVVDDLNAHLIRRREDNPASFGPGVAHHIVERFLDNAIDGHFS
jgi:hypothetical protein